MAKKRTKKTVNVIDSAIVRELKKNRVYSKVVVSEYESPPDLEYFIKTINDKLDELSKEYPDVTVRVYILDKLYDDNNINFLTTTTDSYTFIINDVEIFNSLQNNVLIVPNNIDILFFDNSSNTL